MVGIEEQNKLVEEEREERTRREGTGICIQTHHCQRLHFQLKMRQKRLAAGLCPDSLGSLAAVKANEGNSV